MLGIRQMPENPGQHWLQTGATLVKLARAIRALLKEKHMPDSVYKVIQLVGTSEKSWEEAARNAVNTAGQSLKNLRIAEIDKLDMRVEDGKVAAFRARVNISFKYEACQNR